MSQKTLLNATEIHVALHRLACQLIENHNDFSQTVLIGIQPRGGFLAKRLVRLLQNDYKIKDVQLGLLDTTFYRDDFRRSEKPLEANKTAIDFVVEDKKVVFIDDVLYTGRSIRPMQLRPGGHVWYVGIVNNIPRITFTENSAIGVTSASFYYDDTVVYIFVK